MEINQTTIDENNCLIVQRNTKNNGVLIIKEISRNIAKDMIIKNHYSHKWNSIFGKLNVGIFQNGVCLGVAVYGGLMNPNSYKTIAEINSDEIIELNRLWIDDSLGKNTETLLISASFKILKYKFPQVKLVQSFADGRLGCGTIYKASNFNYYGCTTSLFFEDVDTKEVHHKVSFEDARRPSGLLNKNRLYIDNKLKPFYVKTYKYIYILDKNTKMNIKSQSYPTYNKGFEYCNYRHGRSLITKIMIMYHDIGDYSYKNKCLDILKNEFNMTMTEIRDEMLRQNENKNYIYFKNKYIKSIDIKKLLENRE